MKILIDIGGLLAYCPVLPLLFKWTCPNSLCVLQLWTCVCARNSTTEAQLLSFLCWHLPSTSSGQDISVFFCKPDWSCNSSILSREWHFNICFKCLLFRHLILISHCLWRYQFKAVPFLIRSSLMCTEDFVFPAAVRTQLFSSCWAPRNPPSAAARCSAWRCHSPCFLTEQIILLGAVGCFHQFLQG